MVSFWSSLRAAQFSLSSPRRVKSFANRVRLSLHEHFNCQVSLRTDFTTGRKCRWPGGDKKGVQMKMKTGESPRQIRRFRIAVQCASILGLLASAMGTATAAQQELKPTS